MGDNVEPLKWTDLSEDKQDGIKLFYNDMLLLIEFGNKANPNLFHYLYGEQSGSHLWSKFREFDNLFKFLNYLDVGNRQTLLINVLGHNRKIHGSSSNPLYAHCHK